jgi:CheY-like chemotaxis protein
VFVNLLNNATKYTPEGGAIRVSASRAGDWARISVRDTGIGIPEHMLGHVFDLFTQGDELPAGHAQGGLGVGLTLVRTLTEGHGGRVEAFSDGLGKGTEFVVHLPLSTEVIRGSQARGTPRIDLRGQSVLVVDDNHDAADSLGTLLESFGAEVQVLYSGAEALAAIGRRRPSLVLLDIGMPSMDGFEVARRIRSTASGATLPLIALTGWGQTHDREAAFAAGFNYHLTKPLDPVRLQEILSAISGP